MRTVLRVLFFRAGADELRGLSRRHLALGFLLTWIVGMGRWWEDPRANLLQHLGAGSILYVVLLAAFFWLLIWPLSPRGWPYSNVLTMITLTSPPALVYAMPVRAWFEMATAQQARLWFLALVAAWRVLLWARYLRVGVGLSIPATVVTTFFPLTFIIFTLTSLNLERVVFNLMGGVSPADRTVNDAAFGALFLLSMLSVLLFVPLLAAYVILAIRRLRERSASAGGRASDG